MDISFKDEARLILGDLQQLRRKLHQNPERDLRLPFTQKTVLEELASLPLEIHTGEKLDSVVAVLHGSRPGPTVLLRGDMDGLPVVEDTGLDFASTNGSMHACGHDLHIAGLVGAARLLSAHQDALAGTVVFMFQPGEEAAGGADKMIEEGLLEITGELPVAAYAIHVWSSVPAGVFATRKGAVMAGANLLTVTVNGRGGHGSAPFMTIDPVPVACEIVLAIQAFVTRKVDVFDPVVITVAQLTGSTAPNAIPNTASFTASVRTLSQKSWDLLDQQLPILADGIASAYGCTVTVDFKKHYPATINDAEVTDETLALLREEFGPERVVEAPDPVMGSEDFSYLLEKVPGTFMMLGALAEGLTPETAATNHSPNVLFNDAVLGDEAAALASLAFEKLRSIEGSSNE